MMDSNTCTLVQLTFQYMFLYVYYENLIWKNEIYILKLKLGFIWKVMQLNSGI